MVRFIVWFAVLALAMAGCGHSNTSTPATVTSSQSSAEPSTVPTQSWTMPDLRGQNLQAAQDAIQALTDNKVFFSTSTDLTGQGRHQVLDRNWQVCNSTPDPGAPFPDGAAVNFGVVRIDSESCP